MNNTDQHLNTKTKYILLKTIAGNCWYCRACKKEIVSEKAGFPSVLAGTPMEWIGEQEHGEVKKEKKS